jgi:hypothetical protein
MMLGELYDILSDKLKTGEFNRMDTVYVEGGEIDSDWHPVTDVNKRGSCEVNFCIDARIGEDLF